MLDLTEKRVFLYFVVCSLTEDGSFYSKPLLAFSNSHPLSILCVPVCPYPNHRKIPSPFIHIPHPHRSNPTPGPWSPISDTSIATQAKYPPVLPPPSPQPHTLSSSSPKTCKLRLACHFPLFHFPSDFLPKNYSS